jgi:hypothetical protein
MLPLILSANGSGILKWWVDASFAVHPNMRGGALFLKFRDQIMGVIPARDPGPGKAKPRNGELDTHKVKPSRGKSGKSSSLVVVEARQETGLVPLGKERYHRSVLGEASKRKKDGRSKAGSG